MICSAATSGRVPEPLVGGAASHHRQDQDSGGGGEGSLSGDARRPDHRRDRPGIRDVVLARHLRAGRDACARDRASQRGDHEVLSDRGGEGEAGGSRGCGGDQHAGRAGRHRQGRSRRARPIGEGRQHPGRIGSRSNEKKRVRPDRGARGDQLRRPCRWPRAGAWRRRARSRRPKPTIRIGRCGWSRPRRPAAIPDVLARLLSQKLTGAFGKSFVVENVPGAGGVVAAKMVAAAPPDGHVLMLGDSGAMAINVVLNPDLGYDPLRDFTPITGAGHGADRAGRASRRCRRNTLQEFIALGQVEARRAELRLGRARLDPPSHDGDLRRADRHRPAARALSRRHRIWSTGCSRARCRPAGPAFRTCCR